MAAMEYIATFFTHFGAVRFKRECDRAGISARMMPVPRSLSSSCGTCVRFEADAGTSVPETPEREQIVRVTDKGFEEIWRAEE